MQDHFVIWQPRDVVGGDLYWYRRVEGGFIISVCDCTGHGVPGAFLTMIASGALDRALREHPKGDPAELLKTMNRSVQISLGQDQDDGESDDGLELGICRINYDTNEITYAGARFSLFKVSDEGEIKETKGYKSGIGYCKVPIDQAFTNHSLQPTETDTYVMVSDGILDQIGGPKRRGFGKKRFLKLLSSSAGKPLEDQKRIILDEFESYQGGESRRDDISALGFKVRKLES
ncbi:MAG: SpoIIE family protein phosphatase [Rhodospirillales bacterium]|nr:SpoIIE family protein phosphatase [Rhodospirillales bacterium]